MKRFAYEVRDLHQLLCISKSHDEAYAHRVIFSSISMTGRSVMSGGNCIIFCYSALLLNGLLPY